MLDARRKTWDMELLTAFGIPTDILPPMTATGATLGTLLPGVAEETGAAETVCVASAGHDTASAVAAAPASGSAGDWCYISSGTWSLMGVEIPEPELGPQALAANFTNEGGVAGTIRFLKNIMGLWLVQQCRKSFERAGHAYDYAQLAAQAHAAPAFGSVVDPDFDGFLNPPDMPTALQAYCRRTGQTPPETPGQLVRCCLESLACRYRWVLERMEAILGRSFNSIHIVGGGSQNQLLCHMTADICRRPVVAGPTEATALGNLLVQLMGLGELQSLSDLRAVVRASTETSFYDPRPDDRWEDRYAKFLKLAGG
jgi:rhamnulokinase